MTITREKLAKMIDHSIVKAEATTELVTKFCEEAKEYGFGAVCINSSNVPLTSKLLRGSGVRICVGVAFPFGAAATQVKVFETKYAIENGADDIDMVMNIGAFKSKDYNLVKKDIEAVVKTAKTEGEKIGKNIIVKVILETGYLTDEEILKASQLVKEAGADFIKTCTGFGPRGAKTNDVKLIRKAVGEEMGLKVAGGIGTFEEALKMVEAGATRIGASHSVDIIKGCHP